MIFVLCVSLLGGVGISTSTRCVFGLGVGFATLSTDSSGLSSSSSSLTAFFVGGALAGFLVGAAFLA